MKLKDMLLSHFLKKGSAQRSMYVKLNLWSSTRFSIYGMYVLATLVLLHVSINHLECFAGSVDSV